MTNNEFVSKLQELRYDAMDQARVEYKHVVLRNTGERLAFMVGYRYATRNAEELLLAENAIAKEPVDAP